MIFSILTNNLGPGLLAIRMVPKMLETARKHSVYPRLVVVASDTHYWTTIEKDIIASSSILAKLSDKEYCTKEYVLIYYYLSLPPTHEQSDDSPIPRYQMCVTQYLHFAQTNLILPYSAQRSLCPSSARPCSVFPSDHSQLCYAGSLLLGPRIWCPY